MKDVLIEYANLRALKLNKEEEFKAWVKQVDMRIAQLAPQVLQHLEESGQKTIHVSNGMLGTTVKHTASATTIAEFTEWLKQDPEHINYATVKPRQKAVEEYVDTHGEPMPGIRYERYLEVTFKRG